MAAKKAKKSAAKPSKKKVALMTLISGVEGLAVYLNNYRIAGPKPWGGGSVQREWKVNPEHIKEALSKTS